MKLDNRNNVYKIWFRKFLATIILTTLLITIGFADYFNTPVLGINRAWYLILLVVFYLCLAAYNYLLLPNYVSYSDNGDKIVLRYYPVRLLNRKKHSIEIPKQSFVAWEIKKFLFGKYEMLYVSAKFKSQIAKYPGISLSVVNSSDRKKIKAALNLYVKKKFGTN